MRTAETNTSTATLWSRPASACTITIRRRAVPHVHESPTDSPTGGSAVSTQSYTLGWTENLLQVVFLPGPAGRADQQDLGINRRLLYLPRTENEERQFCWFFWRQLVDKEILSQDQTERWCGERYQTQTVKPTENWGLMTTSDTKNPLLSHEGQFAAVYGRWWCLWNTHEEESALKTFKVDYM